MKEASVPTAALADACVKKGIPFIVLPGKIRTAFPTAPFAGPAVAVRHHGSVDIFLEALGDAPAGHVLVIDNQARLDEGCIGDLTVLEAKSAGCQGVIVWGCHRDAEELQRIGLPVFSLGCFPVGPRGTEGRSAAIGSADIDGQVVTSGDWVCADSDGVVVVSRQNIGEALTAAAEIVKLERRQADLMRTGVSLRRQLGFAEFLQLRQKDPAYSLRQHLAQVGGAIET